MIILLIGPHRSGKSTLAKAICARIAQAQHFDLDDVIADAEGRGVMNVCSAVGNAEFSRLCHQHIQRINQTCGNELCLIAVGAGAFLDSDVALSWLPAYHTVALLAQPERLYERADKNCFKTFEQYVANQLSPDRMRVYNSARFTIQVPPGEQKESEHALLQHLLDIKAIHV